MHLFLHSPTLINIAYLLITYLVTTSANGSYSLK